MLVIKLDIDIVVLLLGIDPYVVILSQHSSVLEILLFHAKR